MKKILTSLLVVILTIGLFAGCAKKETPETSSDKTTTSDSTSTDNKSTEDNTKTDDAKADESKKYEDGIYFAAEKTFNEQNGWKAVVTLEVKDGKIVSVDWNGAHKDAGVDKKTSSKDGLYGLVKYSDATKEWHEQAEFAEKFLLEAGDPTAITYSDDEGHTDAISGVSIHVSEFFKLAEEALANGPVGYGKWADGAYSLEDEAFNEKSGWKATFNTTVISGYIMSANWNGIHKEDGDDKKTRSVNGEYVLANDGGKTWHEQAALIEEKLLETQDPTAVTVTDSGNTDDVAGVSIHVSEFFTLASKALKTR